MRDTESDWLPFTIGAVTATFAAMGAIAVAVSGILPAGHVINDEALSTAVTSTSTSTSTSPTAAIVTPSPTQLTVVPRSGVTVAGTAGDLPAGTTLWLVHQFPRSQQFAFDPSPLTVTGGTWSVVDRSFPDASAGDRVNLHLLVATSPCADAIRAIVPTATGRRLVPELPPACPVPVSEARLTVAPETGAPETDVP